MLGNKINRVVNKANALLRPYQMEQIFPGHDERHPHGVWFRLHFHNKEIRTEGETRFHEIYSNVYKH